MVGVRHASKLTDLPQVGDRKPVNVLPSAKSIGLGVAHTRDARERSAVRFDVLIQNKNHDLAHLLGQIFPALEREDLPSDLRPELASFVVLVKEVRIGSICLSRLFSLAHLVPFLRLIHRLSDDSGLTETLIAEHTQEGFAERFPLRERELLHLVGCELRGEIHEAALSAQLSRARLAELDPYPARLVHAEDFGAAAAEDRSNWLESS
jgi:hypothetical protein